MRRKTFRYLLRIASRVPGVYAALAFFAARRVTVRGWSMAPALLPGERLLFDRLAYVRGRPRASDVVLVAYPLRPELLMVKRLAGIPGDTIGERTLARGEYWVLGDNAEESTDSREFGPVRRRDLLGRAWLRYWPTERWKVWR
jgi:nickel-type superoxide dismutase maturation protease